MIVFKLYFKILAKAKYFVLITLGIFIALTLVIMNLLPEQTNIYSEHKASVVFIDNDNTTFTKGLKTYLEKYADYKDIKKENLDEAFLYRDVEFIMEIPDGFTDSFTKDENLLIKYRAVPDSSSSYTFSAQAEKYLNFARTYLNNDLENDDLTEAVINNLNQEATIKLTDTERIDYYSIYFYYNYSFYIIMMLLVSLIGTIMFSFKSIEIKRRNDIGMISNRKMNLILILANALLGLSILLILIIVSIILYPDEIFKPNGLLFVLNTFSFTVANIALAYLVSTILKSVNAISAAGTLISLGAAFMTGIFIPQDFLSPTVLNIGKILPSYWSVRANNVIVNLTNFNFSLSSPVVQSFLAQILFTIIFIALAILISKKRSQAEH